MNSFIRNQLLRCAKSDFFSDSIRKKFFYFCGIKTRTVKIKKDVTLGKNIVIGHNSSLNFSCKISGDTILGNNVIVAPEVLFEIYTHEIGSAQKRAGKWYTKPIVVEDGVWIGTRVIILSGVTIGKGCVIAAGAVVVKDCEPNGLYAGVPARRVKELGEA